MLAVMLAVLPPAITLPLHGVVQAGSNLGRAVTLHPHIRRSVIGWFSAGTLVGLVIGSRLFVSLSVELLSIILGVLILWTVWMPKPVNRPIADRRFFVVGALASFCTLFVGATGPMVAAFWNVAQMGKLGVVATHAASMVIQHSGKALTFGALGFDYGPWLALIVAMLVAGQLGTMLGARLLDRMPERAFAIGFKTVLTLLALRLLVDAALSLAKA